MMVAVTLKIYFTSLFLLDVPSSSYENSGACLPCVGSENTVLLIPAKAVAAFHPFSLFPRAVSLGPIIELYQCTVETQYFECPR